MRCTPADRLAHPSEHVIRERPATGWRARESRPTLVRQSVTWALPVKTGAADERVVGHREPDPVSRTSVLRRGSPRGGVLDDCSQAAGVPPQGGGAGPPAREVDRPRPPTTWVSRSRRRVEARPNRAGGPQGLAHIPRQLPSIEVRITRSNRRSSRNGWLSRRTCARHERMEH